MASRFDISLIEAGLDTQIIGRTGKNELFDEIVSTNDRAIELARSGAPEGVLVLARQQMGGRGRQGRSWLSPPDSGVFMSLILRPTLEFSALPLFSFAAGVAAAEAVERAAGVKIALKWVNDLVAGDKKAGGILAEMPGVLKTAVNHSDGWILPPAVILGIGINLSVGDEDLPDELKGRVASLDALSGAEVDANYLVSEICNSLEAQYNHLRYGASECVLAEWKKRSATLGKRVRAFCGNEHLEGIAVDIAESGALILRMDSGEIRELYAGEVSIRLNDGRYA